MSISLAIPDLIVTPHKTILPENNIQNNNNNINNNIKNNFNNIGNTKEKNAIFHD